MDTAALSAEDNATVRQALAAVADGPYFPDWEFQTLIGVDREAVRSAARRWPSLGEDREGGFATVVNALNNLVGYPHGQDAALASAVSGGRERVSEALDRLVDAR